MSQNLLKREKVVGRRNPILNATDKGGDLCSCKDCTPLGPFKRLRKVFHLEILYELENRLDFFEQFPYDVDKVFYWMQREGEC